MSEFKLCCNFFPQGLSWAWLGFFVGSGLNAGAFFIFLFYFSGTRRIDCQPGLIQSLLEKELLRFPPEEHAQGWAFLWRRNGITTVQFRIMYKYKLLYSVFKSLISQIQIFSIYCTTFYTNFFLEHQCSNLSPSPPRCKWNRLFKRTRGVLHGLYIYM